MRVETIYGVHIVASWEVPLMRYDRVQTTCDVAAEMRDGVKLYADIYKPETAEKVPVLLLRTPYDKSTAQTCVYLDTMWYARYGYMVVVQDCRGRYRSEGEFYPYKYETADSEDTIKWAASLPGSNGEVAMYGFSYPGSVQLLAASNKLPQLKTIMPAMTGCNFYEPWTYEGGSLTQGFIQSWTLSLARDTALRAGDVAGMKRILGVLGQYNSMAYATPLNALFEEIKSYVPYYFDWVEHDTYDDYWKKIAVQERYDDISLPVLHVGGWYDIFISGTIKNFIALRELQKNDPKRGRQKLLIGPWHHVPWQPKVGCVYFGSEAENIVDLVQLKWLDQQMRSTDQTNSSTVSSADADPDVSVFILGANKWAHFDSWPPTSAKQMNLFLHSGGRANATAGDGMLSTKSPESEPWDSFIYDPTFPVPSSGGHGCCFEDMLPMGACDQSSNQMRNDVLVYSTPPLAADLTVAGAVSVLIYASTTAVDTDFTAVLSEVDAGGRAINVCNGIARASRCAVPKEEYVKSSGGSAGAIDDILLASRRFKTGDAKRVLSGEKVYAIEIHLGWIAAMFREGHRIRLEISSSNFPHYERNTNTGNRFADLSEFKTARQILFHDKDHPSALYLQVL